MLEPSVVGLYDDHVTSVPEYFQTTTVERAQTGIRIERRLLKVLKGLAEHLDMPLGELIEGVVLHAFDGEHPFSPATRSKIEGLRAVYEMTLTAADSHRLTEKLRDEVPGRE